uniref:Uncharacterized protein n=1 Tax=Cannabis sativa TaxID=3483 RepID=A0A803PTC5_CANSA
MSGHTIDRYFKIIGYPLEHKIHGRFPNRNDKGPPGKSASANFTGGEEEKIEDMPREKYLVSSLSSSQCQKLMALLAQKVADNSSSNTHDYQPIVSHFLDTMKNKVIGMGKSLAISTT